MPPTPTATAVNPEPAADTAPPPVFHRCNRRLRKFQGRLLASFPRFCYTGGNSSKEVPHSTFLNYYWPPLLLLFYLALAWAGAAWEQRRAPQA